MNLATENRWIWSQIFIIVRNDRQTLMMRVIIIMMIGIIMIDNAYFVPDPEPSILHALTHLLLGVIPWGKDCFHPQNRWRSWVYSGHRARKWQSQDIDPGLCDSEVCTGLTSVKSPNRGFSLWLPLPGSVACWTELCPSPSGSKLPGINLPVPEKLGPSELAWKVTTSQCLLVPLVYDEWLNILATQASPSILFPSCLLKISIKWEAVWAHSLNPLICKAVMGPEWAHVAVVPFPGADLIRFLCSTRMLFPVGIRASASLLPSQAPQLVGEGTYIPAPWSWALSSRVEPLSCFFLWESLDHSHRS